MAQARYIEARGEETWHDVSDLFGAWMESNFPVDNFAWSEGSGEQFLADGTRLLCFTFPDFHGEKIALFISWAESTDRLYGVVESNRLSFPRRPDLYIELPPPKVTPVPPWLR